MPTYKIVEGKIPYGRRRVVAVFSVADELGRSYCNESSLKRAQDFVRRLTDQDAKAEQDRENRELAKAAPGLLQ